MHPVWAEKWTKIGVPVLNFFSSGFWDSSLNWLLSFMLLLDLSASSFALVFAEHEAKYGMDQPRILDRSKSQNSEDEKTSLE